MLTYVQFDETSLFLDNTLRCLLALWEGQTVYFKDMVVAMDPQTRRIGYLLENGGLMGDLSVGVLDELAKDGDWYSE